MHPLTNEAYRLLHEGTLALARAERQGIRVDMAYAEAKKKELTDKIVNLENELKSTKFYKHWQHSIGNKTPNIYSNPQLSVFLYRIKKLQPATSTDSGQGSTDEDALLALNIPELNTLLEIRKLKKVRDTYLEGFIREEVDGFVHPSFNLHLVTTFRSCIAYGTFITVGYKRYKRIENIVAGDTVMCLDHNNEMVGRTVLWAGRTGCKPIMYITKTRGRDLPLTYGHKVMLSNGKYEFAYRLSTTSKIYTEYNSKERIMGLRRGPSASVYDIEVAEFHNFFANGICVHNSSDKPNFQNIPKRDYEAMRICRSTLFPRKGNILMEADLSGAEVRIAATYHKDPVMLKYINDPTTDMHGDMAKQIFLLDNYDKSIPSHKLLRQATKNGFVFPEFYGDYYKNCAKNLVCNWGKLSEGKWKEGQGVDMESGHLSDHLISKGIRSYLAFEKHVQQVENDFWSNRFKVYAQWKEKWWKSYQKNGYVDLLTGFRCSGLLKKTDACNYPIQGTAFHCLLKSFILLDDYLKANKMKSRLIGQIHDSIVIDCFPAEVKTIVDAINTIASDILPAHWEWLKLVPIEFEIEVAPIDGSFADLQPINMQNFD